MAHLARMFHGANDEAVFSPGMPAAPERGEPPCRPVIMTDRALLCYLREIARIIHSTIPKSRMENHKYEQNQLV